MIDIRLYSHFLLRMIDTHDGATCTPFFAHIAAFRPFFTLYFPHLNILANQQVDFSYSNTSVLVQFLFCSSHLYSSLGCIMRFVRTLHLLKYDYQMNSGPQLNLFVTFILRNTFDLYFEKICVHLKLLFPFSQLLYLNLRF